MKMGIRIICDRCGEDITDSGYYGYIALNSRKTYQGDLQQANPFEDKHYCLDCMSTIQEFVSKAPIENNDTSELKVRQKIDYGKILALKNAGWTNQQIADEIGATKEKVAYWASYAKTRKA